MTVSDYIFNFLSSKGVDTVFMITGGQAMFLNDSLFRNKKINYTIDDINYGSIKCEITVSDKEKVEKTN